MSEDNHKIEKLIFNVNYHDFGRVHELQNRVSKIARNELHDQITLLFDRFVNEYQILSFETIDIQINDIHEDDIEHKLTGLIIDELEKVIRNKIFASGFNTHVDDKSGFEKRSRSYIEQVEYYILSGSQLWNSPSKISSLDELINILFEEPEAGTKKFIQLLKKYPDRIRRLAFQLQQSTIYLVLNSLVAKESHFITGFQTLITSLQHDWRFAQIKAIDFDQNIWIFLFNYLLVESSDSFSREALIRSVLRQISVYYKIDYNVLAGRIYLYASTANKRPAIRSSPELLKVISEDRARNVHLLKALNNSPERQFDSSYHAEQLNQDSDSGEEFDQVTELLDKLYVLEYFLNYGSLPFSKPIYGIRELELLFLELILLVPALLKAMVIRMGKFDQVRGRIVSNFTEPLIHSLIIVIEPTEADIILEYAEGTEEVRVKSSVSYVPERDFKKAVWKFILDFLLVEKTGEFNTRMFIYYNLQKLSSHYNIAYSVVLNIMESSAVVNTRSAARYQILANTIKELKLESIAKDSSRNAKKVLKPIAPKEEFTYEYKRDVFMYWLAKNNLPWWLSSNDLSNTRGEYFHFFKISESKNWKNGYRMLQFTDSQRTKFATGTSENYNAFVHAWLDNNMKERIRNWYPKFEPEIIYEELILKYPNEAVLILKFAGLKADTRNRIIRQISWKLVQKVFGLVLGEQMATDLLEKLPRLLAGNSVFKIDSTKALSEDIALVVWEILLNHSYNVPDEKTLLTEVVNKISYKYTGLQQILQELRVDSAAARDLNSGGLLFEVYNRMTNNNDADNKTIDQWSEKILADIVLKKELPFGKMGLESAIENDFISDAIYLLYKNNPARLKKILTGANIPVASLLFFYDLIKSSKSVFKNEISDWLIASLTYRGLYESLPIIAPETLKILSANPRLLLSDSSGARDNLNARIMLNQLLTNKTAMKDFLERQVSAGAIFPTIQFISKNCTDDQVNKLLKHSGFEWGNDTWTHINKTAKLFFSGADNAMTLDRLKPLYRRFNLLILAGKYRITSHEDYISNFLSFLMDEISNTGVSFLIQFIQRLKQAYPGSSRLQAILQTFDRKIKKQMHRYEENASTTVLKELEANYSRFLSPDAANATAPPHDLPTNKDKSKLARASQQDKLLTGTKLYFSQIAGKPNPSMNIELSKIERELEKSKIKDREAAKSREEAQKKLENQNKTPYTIENNNLYIRNAGLVLLHPFLATYFTRLGLLQKGKFIDEETQMRAALLMEYLVWKTSDAPEHHLPLNKILVGLPVEAPIIRSIAMTEAEFELSEQMLKAVTQSWDKLKNTSVDNLRVSFLQREGAMTNKDGDWVIRVEQRAYDVLLATLPWGLGMVRHSWMQQTIFIEWT